MIDLIDCDESWEDLFDCFVICLMADRPDCNWNKESWKEKEKKVEEDVEKVLDFICIVGIDMQWIGMRIMEVETIPMSQIKL